MKLRTLTDSIRLRLSQTEVNQISETGTVSDSVTFPSDSTFTYTLTESESALKAEFSGNALTVAVPAKTLHEWAGSLEVGIKDEIPMAGDRVLKVLIEKDFACLKPRDEDESDLFPNPDADTERC